MYSYFHKLSDSKFSYVFTRFWCQELWVYHRWIWELPTFFMVQKYTYFESESCLIYTSLKAFSVCLLFFNIFTYLAALGLSCCLWDLVAPSGTGSAPPNSRTAPHLHLWGQESPESIQFQINFHRFLFFFFLSFRSPWVFLIIFSFLGNDLFHSGFQYLSL